MRILAALLALALAALFAAPAQARVLRIVTLEVPPLVVKGRDGVARGPVCAIVREALGRAGYRTDIDIVPWQRALVLVKQGQADGIFAASKTEERTGFLIYPDEPLYTARVVIVADAAKDLRMDRDGTGTDGLVVGMLKGGSHGQKLEDFLRNARFERIDRFPLQKQGALMTLHGRQDAFIIVDAVLPHFKTLLGQDHCLEIVKTPCGDPFIIDEIPGYLAFSKAHMDEKDVRMIENALRELKDDGTFERLMRE